MATKITFDVGFNVNSSQLTAARTQLEQIQRLTSGDFMRLNDTGLERANSAMQKIQQTTLSVKTAMNAAFNSRMNTFSVDTFNTSLQRTGLTLGSVGAQYAQLGANGYKAFGNLVTNQSKLNATISQTKGLLSNMGDTLVNAFKWSAAYGTINRITNEIRQSIKYVEELDKTLTSIAIVSGKSADQMERFAVQANKAARELGASTKTFSGTAQTFYQQGLGDEDVMARSTVATKVANVTGLNAKEAADYVTSIANGYKVAGNEVEKYMDVVAKVGDTTASSFKELAEGMSKVSSAANEMGVSEEQLASMLATVISVTREDAASVGNTFKTVFGRINDIKAGTADADISLGKYTSTLKELGFNVLDANGRLEDTGVTMEKIGAKWSTLTKEQKLNLAQTMGGIRQYSKLMALFENWDMYEKSLKNASSAAGTLNKEQEVYMNSIEGHMNALTAAGERVSSSLIDSKSFKVILDIVTAITDRVNDFVNGIGGAGGAFMLLGTIATRVLNTQIAAGITNMITKASQATQQMNNWKKSTDQLKATYEQLEKEVAAASSAGDKQLAAQQTRQMNIVGAQKEMRERMAPYAPAIIKSPALTQEFNELTERRTAHAVAQAEWDARKEVAGKVFTAVTKGKQTSDYTNIDLSKTLSEQNDNARKNALGRLADVKEKLTTDSVASNRSYFMNQIGLEGTEKLQAAKILRGIGKAGQEIGLSSSNDDKTAGKQLLQRHAKLSTKESLSADEQAELEKLDKIMQEAGQKIDKIIQKFVGDVSEAEKTLEDANAGQEGSLNQEGQNLDQDEGALRQKAAAQAAGEAFSSAASGVMSFGMALTSLMSIKDIVSNDDLTPLEKFSQLLTAVGMGVPMLISSFSQFGTALKSGKVAMKAFEEATLRKVLADQIENGAIGKKITLEKLLTLAKQENIVVSKALAKAAWESLGPYVAIAIAIAAVVAALYALSKAMSKDADAAKEANHANEEAAASAERATAAYDKLKSSLQSIDEHTKQLHTLTKGTDEWRAALEKVNQEVLELIKNYPNLAKYVYRDSEGILHISEEGQSAELKARQTAAEKANRTAALANINANQKNQQASETAFRRQAVYNDEAVTWGGVAATAGGGLSPLTGGPLVMLSGISKLFENASSVKQYDTKIDSLIAQMSASPELFDTREKAIAQFVDTLGISITQATELYDKHNGSLQDLVNSEKANAEANDVFADQVLQGSDVYKNATEEEKKYMRQQAINATKEANENWRTEGAKYGYTTGLGNMDLQEDKIAQEYIAATGFKMKSLDKTKNQLEYYDAEGQVVSTSLEDAVIYLTQQKAAEQVAKDAEKYKSQLNDIAKDLKMSTTTINSLSRDRLNLYDMELKDLLNVQKNIDSITNKWKELGYESKAAMKAALDAQLSNALPQQYFETARQLERGEITMEGLPEEFQVDPQSYLQARDKLEITGQTVVPITYAPNGYTDNEPTETSDYSNPTTYYGWRYGRPKTDILAGTPQIKAETKAETRATKEIEEELFKPLFEQAEQSGNPSPVEAAQRLAKDYSQLNSKTVDNAVQNLSQDDAIRVRNAVADKATKIEQYTAEEEGKDKARRDAPAQDIVNSLMGVDDDIKNKFRDKISEALGNADSFPLDNLEELQNKLTEMANDMGLSGGQTKQLTEAIQMMGMSAEEAAAKIMRTKGIQQLENEKMIAADNIDSNTKTALTNKITLTNVNDWFQEELSDQQRNELKEFQKKMTEATTASEKLEILQDINNWQNQNELTLKEGGGLAGANAQVEKDEYAQKYIATSQTQTQLRDEDFVETNKKKYIENGKFDEDAFRQWANSKEQHWDKEDIDRVAAAFEKAAEAEQKLLNPEGKTILDPEKAAAAIKDLGHLGKAFDELNAKGKISYETMADLKKTFEGTAGFEDAFKKLQEGAMSLEEFASTMTYNKIKDAFGGIQGLANAKQEDVAALLEEAGAADADRVAQEMLAHAKLEAAMASDPSISSEQTQALLEEYAKVTNNAEAWTMLKIARDELNGQTYNSFEEFCQGEGLTADEDARKLWALYKIKQLLSSNLIGTDNKISTDDLKTQIGNETYEAIQQYTQTGENGVSKITPEVINKIAQDITSGYGPGGFKVTSGGSKGSGGGGGSKGSGGGGGDGSKGSGDKDKAANDAFKNQMDAIKNAIDNVSASVENLKSKLDLFSESDYTSRLNTYADLLDKNREKIDLAAQSFENLYNIDPANADQAKELTSTIETVGKAYIEAKKAALEYRQSSQDTIVKAFTDATDNLDKQTEMVEKLMERGIKDITGETMFGRSRGFSLGDLLPDVSEDAVEQKRKEAEEIYEIEEQLQKKVYELKKKYTEMEYEENIKKAAGDSGSDSSSSSTKSSGGNTSTSGSGDGTGVAAAVGGMGNTTLTYTMATGDYTSQINESFNMMEAAWNSAVATRPLRAPILDQTSWANFNNNLVQQTKVEAKTLQVVSNEIKAPKVVKPKGQQLKAEQPQPQPQQQVQTPNNAPQVAGQEATDEQILSLQSDRIAESADLREDERQAISDDMDTQQKDLLEDYANLNADYAAGWQTGIATTDTSAGQIENRVNSMQLKVAEPDISAVKNAFYEVAGIMEDMGKATYTPRRPASDGVNGGDDGLLTKTSSQIKRSNWANIAVNVARGQSGVPYLWGGVTPGVGLDCSGLTGYAYSKAGISLPRTSEQQWANGGGTVISDWGSLKKGDQLFFNTNGSGQASHTGIYTGNGRMIHAPHTGDVVKEVGLGDYYRAAFLGARRYAKGTPFGNSIAQYYGIAGENYKPEILVDKKTGKTTYIDKPTPIDIRKTDVIGEKATESMPKFANGTRIDPMEIARFIKGYDSNITDAGIAALLGNIEQESSFDPTNKTIEAYGSGSNRQIARWGLFQLDDERIPGWSNIVNSGTWQDQIVRMLQEAKSGSGIGYNAYANILTNANLSPEEAARLWDKKYERSDGKSREKRASNARKYYANVQQIAGTTSQIASDTATVAKAVPTLEDKIKELSNPVTTYSKQFREQYTNFATFYKYAEEKRKQAEGNWDTRAEGLQFRRALDLTRIVENTELLLYQYQSQAQQLQENRAVMVNALEKGVDLNGEVLTDVTQKAMIEGIAAIDNKLDEISDKWIDALNHFGENIEVMVQQLVSTSNNAIAWSQKSKEVLDTFLGWREGEYDNNSYMKDLIEKGQTDKVIGIKSVGNMQNASDIIQFFRGNSANGDAFFNSDVFKKYVTDPENQKYANLLGVEGVTNARTFALNGFVNMYDTSVEKAIELFANRIAPDGTESYEYTQWKNTVNDIVQVYQKAEAAGKDLSNKDTRREVLEAAGYTGDTVRFFGEHTLDELRGFTVNMKMSDAAIKSALEILDDSLSNLDDALSSLTDSLDKQHELWNLISTIYEKFDTLLSAYITVQSAFKDSASILYGSVGGTALGGSEATQQIANNKQRSVAYKQQQVRNRQQQLAADREAYEQIDALLQQDPNNKALQATHEKYRATYAEDKETYIQDLADMASKAQEAMSAIKDAWISETEEIVDNFVLELTDKMGIDYVEQEFKSIGEIAEQYYDIIDRANKEQELQYKWNSTLTSTISDSARAKILRAQKAEMALLKNKDKLSKYDVDRAEKKYEITMKQIALEEAYNKTATMRLKRDAQGNYSYVYAADASEIAKARTDLQNSMTDLYDFDKKAQQDNLNEFISLIKNFKSEITAGIDMYGADSVQFEKYQKEKIKAFQARFDYLKEQNSTITGNLSDSATAALESLGLRSFSDLSELVTMMTSSAQKSIDAMEFSDIKDTMQLVNRASKAYAADIKEVADALEEAAAAMKDIGSEQETALNKRLTEVKTTIDDSAGKLDSAIQDLVKAFNGMTEKLKEIYDNTVFGKADDTKTNIQYKLDTENGQLLVYKLNAQGETEEHVATSEELDEYFRYGEGKGNVLYDMLRQLFDEEYNDWYNSTGYMYSEKEQNTKKQEVYQKYIGNNMSKVIGAAADKNIVTKYQNAYGVMADIKGTDYADEAMIDMKFQKYKGNPLLDMVLDAAKVWTEKEGLKPGDAEYQKSVDYNYSKLLREGFMPTIEELDQIDQWIKAGDWASVAQAVQKMADALDMSEWGATKAAMLLAGGYDSSPLYDSAKKRAKEEDKPLWQVVKENPDLYGTSAVQEYWKAGHNPEASDIQNKKAEIDRQAVTIGGKAGQDKQIMELWSELIKIPLFKTYINTFVQQEIGTNGGVAIDDSGKAVTDRDAVYTITLARYLVDHYDLLWEMLDKYASHKGTTEEFGQFLFNKLITSGNPVAQAWYDDTREYKTNQAIVNTPLIAGQTAYTFTPSAAVTFDDFATAVTDDNITKAYAKANEDNIDRIIEKFASLPTGTVELVVKTEAGMIVQEAARQEAENGLTN